MPDDSKKPIEELLAASAAARRAQFGKDVAMPGPMRARLHDELARGVLEREPERSVWRWWPRFALAAAMALAVAAPLYWMRRESAPVLSQMQGERAESSVDLPVAETAPLALAGGAMTQPAEKPADKSVSAAISNTMAPELSGSSAFSGGKIALAAQPSKNSALFFEKKTADNGPSMPAPSLALGVEEKAKDARIDRLLTANKELRGGGEEQSTIAKFSNAPSSPASALWPAKKEAKLMDEKESVTRSPARQDFRMKAKQSVNVLSSFQFEQTGNRIRVVDSDGSAYVGQMVPVAASRAASEAPLQSRRLGAAGSKEQSAAGEYRFLATGTNISLQKKIVVNGTYIAAVDESSDADRSDRLKKQQKQQAARVVGIAKIDGKQEIKIDADEVLSPEK